MSETAYQERVLEVEPYGIEPIPKQERHGRASQMFTIWFAINLNVVTWFTGFLGIEFGLSLKHAILALIIGNVLGAVFLAMTSAVGPSAGQPLIPASKRAFGKTGVFGLSFLNFVNNIGWLAVNLVLAAMALQKVVPLGYTPALLILTLATLFIAIYGYNFIHSFAHWMSIVMGILFLIMTVISVKNLPLLLNSSPSNTGEFNLSMFILTIAMAFSYQISYCPIGSDYSRYLPESISGKKVWLTSYLGAFTVCVWLEILGALTATLGAQSGPMDFFAKLMGVFTIPALITVILSIFPVNAMAIYSGGLAALAMGIPMKRWTSAIVCGGIGALLVSFGGGQLADTYKNFLLLLSYWIAPWLGVILSDFYCYRTVPAKDKISYAWAGITAFLVGIIVSIPFMSSILYVGPIAEKYLGHADISYFLSLAVSALVYRVILKVKSRNLPTDDVVQLES
ncbi:MAG TPA: cytosine permease [Verrucomicrobiae bacterium]|nr:cytosine permease [Verrucomicrobiae bacterium]